MSEQNSVDLQNKRVASIVIKNQLATKEQVQKAIAYQKKKEDKPALLKVLVGMKIITKEKAVKIQETLKKRAAAKPKPTEAQKPSPEPKAGDSLGFADDDKVDEMKKKEEKYGQLGFQMFDGEANVDGLAVEDEGQEVMSQAADYFEPVHGSDDKPKKKKKKKKIITAKIGVCANCGKKNSPSDKRCKSCGMPLDVDSLQGRPEELNKRNWKMIVIPLAVAVVVAIFAIIMAGGEKKDEDTGNGKTDADRKSVRAVQKEYNSLADKVQDIKSSDLEGAKVLLGKFENFISKNPKYKSKCKVYMDGLKKKIKKGEENALLENPEDPMPDDDDFTDPVVGDDDDELPPQVGPQDSKARKDFLAKRIAAFKQGLTDLFNFYEPGWKQASMDFRKAKSKIYNTYCTETVELMIEYLTEEKMPVMPFPAVTEKDKRIVFDNEPWGVCLNFLIIYHKYTTKKDEMFTIFKKYFDRYPSNIVGKIRILGVHRYLDFEDFLMDDDAKFSPEMGRLRESVRTSFFRLLAKMPAEYDDKVAKQLKPLLNNEKIDKIREAANWYVAHKPLEVKDKLVTWLGSEENRISNMARSLINKIATGEDIKNEVKLEYAQSIRELIEKSETPEANVIELLIMLDKDGSKADMMKLMEHSHLAIDINWKDQFLYRLQKILKNDILAWYPDIVKEIKIQRVFREWALNQIKKDADGSKSKTDAFISLVISLLTNLEDPLNPLEILEGSTKDRDDLWSEFAVFFDNHSRSDCYNLLLVMHDCDPTKSFVKAEEFLNDKNSNADAKANIFRWYAENLGDDEKVLEMVSTLENQKGLASVVKIELENVKVDLMFKNVDNKRFEQIQRCQQVASGRGNTNIISIEKNGKYLGSAEVAGNELKVYNTKTGEVTAINRKAVDTAWVKWKKDWDKWDADEKKEDADEPQPPPGKKPFFGEQIIAMMFESSSTFRLLTSRGNVEGWEFGRPRKISPEMPAMGYCTYAQDLTARVKELKDIEMVASSVTASNGSEYLGIKIAGDQVLIINFKSGKFITKISPGSFSTLRFDEEAKKVMFFGGGNTSKVRIFRCKKKSKALTLDILLDRDDTATFSERGKFAYVTNKGYIWRFDAETGEKFPVYILPSVPVDGFYQFYTLNNGKFLVECNKKKIRVRQLENGNTIMAIGKLDDTSNVMRVFVAEGGDHIAFLMQDSSVIISEAK